METLGDRAYRGTPSVSTRMVDLYYADARAEDKRRILAEFRKEDTHLRCVFATIAFGLGVEIKDVRKVIHWGAPRDTLGYWQEVGRCGRDTKPSEAHLYVYPGSLNKARVSQDMIDFCRLPCTSCLREYILKFLFVQGMSQASSAAGNGRCCFHCGKWITWTPDILP